MSQCTISSAALPPMVILIIWEILTCFPTPISYHHITAFGMCIGNLHHVHNFQSEETFAVNDDVKGIPTLGHTSEDISVIVKNTQLGTIAVVGDLFHSEEDMEDSSLWRSRSQDPARQEANRHKILRLVDYVVPGHGKIFQTPRK